MARVSAVRTPAYPLVLGAAAACYAALGAVVALLPGYVPRLGGTATLAGLAVGAPALTGAAARPLGGAGPTDTNPLPS